MTHEQVPDVPLAISSAAKLDLFNTIIKLIAIENINKIVVIVIVLFTINFS